MKFLSEALSSCPRRDRAAHVFNVLARSYEQCRVFEPPDLSEVITDSYDCLPFVYIISPGTI